MKTTAIIIDDESDAQNLIVLLLEKLFPEIKVVKKANTVNEAYTFLSVNTVDLMFLDIQMGNQNGFDLLEKLEKQLLPKVIFVTAHDEYAIRAVKVAAQDYILKPVNEAEFKKAVDRALSEEFNTPVHFPKTGIPKIALPSLTGLDFVDIDEIIRCEADNNYTLVFFTNGDKRIISRTLAKFESDLTPYCFLRVHHKHLVNLKKIKSYSKGRGGGFIVMDNQQTIPVSSRRKHHLIEAFTS